ncbi:putative ATPase [Chitinophaga skermanii]|uniref:Putative ATPase n=1 Tax=Chitinophaga skermanii TaxID=331697 RepID=A0A327Q066_9BACT|nr:AAA family ATPase [Chitinophaga skermanii]RAI97443.1 putative ATPase [Chitinophaga skermanii]
MLEKITIKNFKSIDELTIELGRFNVLIGENGCGKSNILEGIGFAAAAIDNKLEDDQLALRGIRTSSAESVRSGFEKQSLTENIFFKLEANSEVREITLINSNTPYSSWREDPYSRRQKYGFKDFDSIIKQLTDVIKGSANGDVDSEDLNGLIKIIEEESTARMAIFGPIAQFLIYSPENYFLRNLNIDTTYIQPLGHRGEGLLKLIKIIKQTNPSQFDTIIQHLCLIDWLQEVEVKDDPTGLEDEIILKDKYLEEGLLTIDLKNVNEGFYYLLFYFTLFISDYSPKLFAIDNIDTALNPKLCSEVISVLVKLAREYNKQVIVTTHNPAVLDGLNLNNEDERLFTVARNINGKTRINRVLKGTPLEGEESLRLSEKFLRGYIGGLPKNF